ncbi:amino acid adenylation domain-containing protein [Pseudomonas urmiensis]|uniref:Amino acid adenylation domain-containing protein n=1 Tax=Pseudomonas urmiensis TaxID=2745493 RepID=A0ABW8NUP1_9PSED
MDKTTAERIAKRFVALPLEQRRQVLDKMSASGQSFKLLPIAATRHEVARIPLSYAQQRLMFLWQLEPTSAFYNVPMAVRLEGELDVAAMAKALELLVQRHETLRTRLVMEEGECYQQILDQSPVALAQVKVAAADLDTLVRDELRRPFDLFNEPLLRVKLFQVDPSHHVLTVCMHHIISDGWSSELMVQTFVSFYDALVAGQPVNPEPLAIQYADYAIWQRAWLEAGEGERQLQYWQAQLGSEQPLLDLPLDFPRPAQPSYQGAVVRADLPPALSSALRSLAQSKGQTVFMVLLGALAVVLSRYSGQDDIRIGVPNAGRNRKDLEGLIGFFINTQVLRVQVDEQATFDSLLEQVRQVVAEAQSHQELPFEQLVDALAPERNLSHNPLFQFKLNQNVAGEAAGSEQSKTLSGLSVEEYPLSGADARFDLAFDFTDSGEQIQAYFTYATDLFKASTIERMVGALHALLQRLVDTPSSRLLAHTEGQRALLPGEQAEFPCEDVLALWRQAVQGAGERPAVRAGAQQLSYSELDRQSNQLAHHLQTLGVAPGDLVALCQERSVEWVISLLAVLKVGAAFLPLDSAQPVERLAQLVGDSGAVLLLQDPQVALSGLEACPAMPFDADAWRHCPNSPLDTAVVPAQPAYVIYTSGSTGQPKGVVVAHGTLANYVQGIEQRLQLPAGASMAMVSTVAADLGHTVLFGALAGGRLLHLLSREHAFDPDAFAGYMAEHQVDVLKIVPSHLQGLLQASEPQKVLPRQLLIVGGEACPWSLVEKVAQLRPDCRLVNHYGPTETTVGILSHEVTELEPGTRTVPVGKPLPNSHVCLLDSALNPVAERVAGELYLGGKGVAQGYLGRPAMTAERFVPDPTGQGTRLYRAGDRARLQQGKVEFLGRADEQVKIRGYRVEPGEIGELLRGLPGVQDAVVVPMALEGDPDRLQLLAYVVAPASSATELLSQLQARLPDYMVPAHLVLLECLPLTANGKLDKRALPKPEIASKAYVAPVGEIEEKLAAIWADVLKLEQVGTGDNFFELGGDSILSLQIIARAKRQGIKLSPKQLFEKQTIAALAQVAKLVQDKPKPAAVATPEAGGAIALLPIQARFFDTAIEQRHHWNQAVLLTPLQRLQPKALDQALTTVLNEHEALRLSFTCNDRQWHVEPRRQAIEALLQVVTLNQPSALEAHATQIQASLSLERGELVRAVLFELPGGQQRLLLAIHHLVVDGVSWRILLEDLQSAYQQASQGQPISLAGRSASCRQWAQRLTEYARSDALLAERSYWLQALSEEDAQFPCDTPGAAATLREAAHASSRLDKALTHKLLKVAPAAYRTQVNDLLLTALARVLCQWSGQPAVSIQLEGHGREDLFDDLDLSRTVGWFTSLFPVRLSPQGSVGDSIKRIKQQLWQVPNKGIGYGVLRYLGDAEFARQLADVAQPRVTFNYLGQFDGSFSEDSGALFVPAGESAGRSQGEDAPLGNWLSVNGQVYDGELRLDWTYSREMYRAETIQGLARALEQALEEVIMHCLEDGAQGVTPADFPLAGLSQAQLDRLPVAARDIEDIYPLSPMQEGLLMHTLLEPGSGIYLMQYCYQVDHAIDIDAFNQAWKTVIARHDVLRTSFCWDLGERMVQIVHRRTEPALRVLDWRHLSPAEYEPALQAELEQELQRGFAMDKEVPFRLRLIQLAADRFGFVFSNHHVLLDAWCRMGVVDEFFKVYQGLLGGQTVHLPTPPRYRDFIAWLQRWDRDASRGFWRQELAGFERPTALPFDRAPSREQAQGSVADQLVYLSREQSAQLAQRAQAAQLTVNTLVQGAWALLLQRYSGDRDVLFGVTVAGRPVEFPEMQTTVGLFINSIPLRVKLPGAQAGLSAKAWLKSLLEYNLNLREHEHLPLVDIQACSEIGSGQALFDSLFVFENAPVESSVGAQASSMKVKAGSSRTHTNYPITVVVYPGEVLGLHLSYDQRLFDGDTIAVLLADFQALLLALSEQLDADFHQVAARLQEQARVTPEALPQALQQGYARLFDATVARVPQLPAARCSGRQWSYEELDVQASRLALRLQAAGVGADGLVAVLGERDLSLLGMIVGVFKAGAGYLSLDPSLPLRRLSEVLGLSGAALLVCDQRCAPLAQALLAELDQPPALLVWEQVQTLASRAPLKPLPEAAGKLLAYVIFTSGSTGVPKGVMVEQAGMLNNQLSKLPYLGLQEHDVIAQTASQSFDICVWQLLTAALRGCRVEIFPDAVAQDPQALLQQVEATGVTVLECVPAMIQAMLELPARALPNLRYLLTTGEAMPPALARRWRERYPQIELVNAYGPAECSDDVALYRVLDDAPSVHLPIGTATDHNRLYVLNDLLEPMPARATGELHVAGVGVGRGYLGDPVRTALSFVPDPFSHSPGERLYRTGDLARVRADGQVLEYVGRADFQVKIRGYRIELGEIESRLLAHEAVHSAVVVDVQVAGSKQLVAYWVPRQVSAQAMELRAVLAEHLRSSLPGYMVPGLWVMLDSLPLTANGKLDRKALPAPDASTSQQQYQAPVTAVQQQLAQIWSEVLGVERIGLDDDFFELGGHSLLVVQVVARVGNQMNTEVSLRELFEQPTLAAFSEVVAARQGHGESIQDELAKSLAALKRLTAEEIDELTL